MIAFMCIGVVSAFGLVWCLLVVLSWVFASPQTILLENNNNNLRTCAAPAYVYCSLPRSSPLTTIRALHPAIQLPQPINIPMKLVQLRCRSSGASFSDFCPPQKIKPRLFNSLLISAASVPSPMTAFSNTSCPVLTVPFTSPNAHWTCCWATELVFRCVVHRT